MRRGDGGPRPGSASLERRAGEDTLTAIVTQDSGSTSYSSATRAPAPGRR
jgi:hypothetical protein